MRYGKGGGCKNRKFGRHSCKGGGKQMKGRGRRSRTRMR